MKILKLSHVSIAAVALVSLSACEGRGDQNGTPGASEDDKTEQGTLKWRQAQLVYSPDTRSFGPLGLPNDWGDNPTCAPTGCDPSNPSGGERINRGPVQGATISFNPRVLSLVYINMGEQGKVDSAFAFYPMRRCLNAYGQNAHEIILDEYENSSPKRWPSKGNCVPDPKGMNFVDWSFRSQAKIYMDIEGLDSKFNRKNPVIFTPFGLDRNDPREENYSFYNARVVPNSVQTGDNLLSIDNYFSHLGSNANWRRLRNTNGNGGWNEYREYSMNIYFFAGESEVPLVFDPDTGNGSDD